MKKSQTEGKKELIIILLILLLGVCLFLLNKKNNELKEQVELTEIWATETQNEHNLFTDCANKTLTPIKK